ncbi:reverse transcriptase domain-containing protein [Tanacetum coccineum]|uniref:Reverse transcriptase domain-containing protein n=1 Tax=Tanacetum coccineum TaxID=301880 RepID=A0ABQ5A9C8_9ASTR
MLIASLSSVNLRRLRDQLLDIKNEKDKISFDNISTKWLYFDRLLNTKADVEEFRVKLSTLEVKNSRCTMLSHMDVHEYANIGCCLHIYKVVKARSGGHTVVQTEDGCSFSFGWNKHGQLEVALSLVQCLITDVRDVACGNDFTVWLTSLKGASIRCGTSMLPLADTTAPNLLSLTQRGNIAQNFMRLKEGAIYSVKNFTVLPNKDEFCVMRFVDFMLKFVGDTTVRTSFVKSDGFTRYPFQLVEIHALEPTNNKYLIDAAGYVTNVGRTTQTRTGSKTLDFYLANCRVQQIRVTLWGGLGDLLIEKRTPMWGYRLYSTSSTLIVDDKKIPMLKRLKTDDSGVELTKDILSVENTAPKDGTLKNLLMWARNRKYDSSTFFCEVNIDKVRTKKGWNYPSCGGEKYKKGNLDRKEGRFWCDSCNNSMEYPVIRYRLELEISDDTDEENHSGLPPALANIVGTSHTLELKSHTYYEHGTYESFTCWKVVTSKDVEEGASSGMVAVNDASKAPALKRLNKTPLVATPSKSGEEKKQRREELEDSDAEGSFVADSQPKGGDVACSSDTRKRKRVVLDDSE